jgi:hypothetical protein
MGFDELLQTGLDSIPDELAAAGIMARVDFTQSPSPPSWFGLFLRRPLGGDADYRPVGTPLATRTVRVRHTQGTPVADGGRTPDGPPTDTGADGPPPAALPLAGPYPTHRQIR